MPRYEELGVWQLANKLVMEVCRVANRFPKGDNYEELAIQMKGAAMGVAMNIAEGHSKETLQEYKHFLKIAIKSLKNILSLLNIARQHKLISDANYKSLTKEYERVECLVMAIIKWIENEIDKGTVAA
jgi:four helix bundle protein